MFLRSTMHITPSLSFIILKIFEFRTIDIPYHYKPKRGTILTEYDFICEFTTKEKQVLQDEVNHQCSRTNTYACEYESLYAGIYFTFVVYHFIENIHG